MEVTGAPEDECRQRCKEIEPSAGLKLSWPKMNPLTESSALTKQFRGPNLGFGDSGRACARLVTDVENGRSGHIYPQQLLDCTAGLSKKV